MTGHQPGRSDKPHGAEAMARVAETARQERAQGGEPQARQSGDPNGADAAAHPENREGAEKASADNEPHRSR
jgi:hypothetical protein